ncbi:MAG: PQQ-dependent sugar dehydrogenase [Planctomycetota bacterium]
MSQAIAVSTALATAVCVSLTSTVPSAARNQSPIGSRPQSGTASQAERIVDPLAILPRAAPKPGEEQSQGLPYGLDSAAAIGAYLNGVFPDAEPGSSETFTPQPALGGLTFNEPMDLASHPNPSTPAAPYLFVSERAGRVWAVHEDDTKELFLDVADRCTEAGEGGFMGLAPHPNFGLDGQPGARFVYAFYGYAPDPAALIGVNEIGFFGAYTRLSRFEVPQGATVANPASETVLFQLRLLNSSHRGGDISFGPDGMLYVPMGNQFEFAAGQDMAANMAGGVLRIDVDRDPSRSHPPRRTFPLGFPDEWSGVDYWIPDDNPFQDSTGARFEEYWCLGLRNPHRMDFDDETGELWVGEVGSILHEEVNVIEPAANYGFPFREGFGPGPVGAPATFDGALTDPIAAFERVEATAIIGGFVYRGSLHPGLYGKFICIDHVRDRMFAVTRDPVAGNHETQLIGTFGPGKALSFGRDAGGEILIGTLDANAPLYSLEANQAVPEPPSRLSELGAFTDLADLIPRAGWIPYDLNAPFWSDGAVKSRWVAIPNDGEHDKAAETISRRLRSGRWDFPAGAVTMKHFELPINAAHPRETRRLETRFIVFTEDGHYGLSYHWLADGSDAILANEGRSEVFDVIDAAGNTVQQTWDFPGRIDCRACHGPGTGGALGLRPHQLNRNFVYATGVTDNQLRAWNHIGLFQEPLDEADIPILPRAVSPADSSAPLDLRVQSYLDANCASCHGTGGAGRAVFDARFSTPLYAKGLIFGEVEDDLGFGEAHPVAPLAPDRSLALHRIGLLDGAAMPPLAKNVVDQLGVDVLAEWVETLPPYPHIKLGGEAASAEGTETWPWHAVMDLGSAHLVENSTATELRA